VLGFHLIWSVHHEQTGEVAEQDGRNDTDAPVEVVVRDQNRNIRVGSLLGHVVADSEEAKHENGSRNHRNMNPIWTGSADEFGNCVANCDEHVERQKSDNVLKPFVRNDEVLANFLNAQHINRKDAQCAEKVQPNAEQQEPRLLDQLAVRHFRLLFGLVLLLFQRF